MEEQFVTTVEAAKMIGVSRTTILNWIRRGFNYEKQKGVI